MAAKRYRKSTTLADAFGGRLDLQAGSTVSEEQDHSLKGTASYKGDVLFLDDRPKRGSTHPKDRRLTCYATRTIYDKVRLATVEADYIGLSENPTPYFIEFCGSVGEEAIETHPHFVDVIGGTPSNPKHGAAFDDDGQFLGFPADAPDHLGGVRSYFRPSVVVRISYWQNDRPNPGPLGHVQSPAAIPGLILPSGSQNLLVTNFGHRTLCPSLPPYQITIEMLASGPNGWNTTEIYTY